MTEKCFDVVALGELLVDFTDNGLSGQGNPLFEANPGGAPCNVLAMLKKLGRFCAFVGKVDDDFIWTAVPSCGRGGRHLHGLPRSRPRSPYYSDLCQEVRQRGPGFLFLPQSQRGYDA